MRKQKVFVFMTSKLSLFPVNAHTPLNNRFFFLILLKRPMEHIRINDKIRLEVIKLSMARMIFEAIDRDRDYLEQWLPFVTFTNQPADTEAFISEVSSEGNKRDRIYCIWYKEEFAGLIGFKDTDWENRKTELGYWLAKNMQGKGIITLCIEKLNKYAFQSLKLNRIQIKVAEGNTKSEKIPVRLGYKYEGTEREGELHNNTYLDLKIYSLLKSDR